MANNQDLFNKTYQSLLATYTKDVPEVQYNPQSESSLRAKLENALRPAYDKQIVARQKQTAANRAAVDADAAARGMGSSTWVTDSKNRLNNAEAADISNLNSDYISNLSSQLLQQLLSQEANKIDVDEFNASNKGSASSSHGARRWRTMTSSTRVPEAARSKQAMTRISMSMHSTKQCKQRIISRNLSRSVWLPERSRTGDFNRE